VGKDTAYSESTVQLAAARIHWSDLEGRWVEEGKGKVDVGESVQVQVLGRNRVTLPRRRPCFIIANGPLGNAVTSAAGSLDISAAAEVPLAALLFITEVICGTTETEMGLDQDYGTGRQFSDTHPNSEQQTPRGQFWEPSLPYWPHSALASQLEVQLPDP
jgi:hypothetical protein